MVQVLVILSLLAARAADVAGDRPARDSGWASLFPLYVAVCLCAAFAAGTAHLGRKLDRTGQLSAVDTAHRWMTIARLTTLAALYAGVFLFGWDTFVRRLVGDVILLDELIMVSPVLLTLIATWWLIEPLERRVRDAVLLRHLLDATPVHAPLSRAGFVWQQVRFQLLIVAVPLLCFLAWQEFLDYLAGPISRSWPAWESYAGIAYAAGLVCIIITTPVLLRFLWGAERIAPGALQSRIRAVCAAHKVRVQGPYLWHTSGTMLNGAILGILWPFRYLLLTDALLERMSDEHLEFIIAHEVAHVRKHHLFWLGLGVIATVVLCAWGAGAFAQAMHISDAWLDRLVLPASLAAVSVGLVSSGWISRRFEWDADAFATAHLARAGVGAPRDTISAEVAETAAGALQAVADLNGVPIYKFSFRHGSIAERQARVRSLVGVRTDAMPIARSVLLMKVSTGLLFLAGVGPLLYTWLMDLLRPVLFAGGTP